MAKRRPVGKKLRFEVFKRDGFTCQYCGMKAPDVVLQVDHIEPVVKGGSNSILNLVTSCSGCNSGKSAVQLTDKTALTLQRQQLSDLQDRREQIEMMSKWQKGLIDIDSDATKAVADLWATVCVGYSLNEKGMRCSWFKSGEALSILQDAVASGVPLPKLWAVAGRCRTWSNFTWLIDELLAET